MQGFIRMSGLGTTPLMLVGEGGGRSESKQGQPFVGAAGQVLEKALRTSGLKRDDYSITNLLHCQPPGNELKGAAYEREAIDHCRSFLDAEVAERRPRILLALGELPLRELSRDHVSQELRGYVLPSIYDGVSVIGTFHPSRILRGDWHLFPVLMYDLRVAARYAAYGVPEPHPTAYNLTPTIDDVLAYIDRLERDPSLYISYDCETSEIIGRKGPSDWRRKEIVQIQFSPAAGEAIVLPYEGEFKRLARHIMALGHTKLGWNSRLSDDLLLKANGFSIGGEAFDAMLMFSHLQPSFASGKDAKEGDDKGVPSKLLNLQSAISFYYPYEQPYKAIMRRAIGEEVEVTDELWHDIRVGGAKDVDFTGRIGSKLMQTLKSQGLWDGYYRFKRQLGKVLTKMSERGLPIDRERQEQLRVHIEAQEQQLEAELQTLIPAELKPFKAYKGFPKDLREAVKAAGLWVKCCKPAQFSDIATSLGYEITGENGDCHLIKPLPFNAGSSKQVLSYIQYCIDNDPFKQWFMPLHIDSGKPSANKASMEALIDATDDDALKQIEKCKKIAKLKDYCGEKWRPDDDGCVHAEFRIGATGTGQTTATNPPIQTYPKHFKKDDKWLEETMQRIKSIIKAPDGYVMIETDMVGFHARVQGFLAEDAAYYRLANLDTHSFLTAHYVGVPDKDSLLQMDDDALLKRLKEIKKQYDYERNYLCKRVSFLSQFGGQAEKAATILRLPRIEVEVILNVNRSIFKQAFKELPEKLERMLRRNPKLVTPFGFPRYFWDADPNQAIAFWVANPAHCTIQDALIRLDDRGALEKYGACNLMHDAIWWCCPEQLADECIAVAHEELERPSEVLVNSLGAFTCKADAKVGTDMNSLMEV